MPTVVGMGKLFSHVHSRCVNGFFGPTRYNVCQFGSDSPDAERFDMAERPSAVTFSRMNSYCSKIAATSFGAVLALAALVPARAQDYKPGVVLVKTASGAQGQAATAALSANGAAVSRQLPVAGWKVLRLNGGETVAQALVRIRKIAGVVTAEPDYIRKASAIPNDPQYSRLYAPGVINAPAAWDIGTGNESIVVGVLDSGVSYNHEDLQANMWKNPGEIPDNGIDDDNNGWTDDVYGYDAYDQDSNPKDENGHGTHVAGIIGARGNNGLGVVGVNWNVKIMALRALGPDGTGDSVGVVDALTYAIDMKKRGVNLRVINHSYGSYGFSTLEQDTLREAALAGIVNVCAAGNGILTEVDGRLEYVGADNDSLPLYPASYDVAGLLSVAASDQDDLRAGFSNFGATSVDLAAPGVGIYSTFLGGKSAYAFESGTSMSSPCVAGAAALLLSRNPGLAPGQVRNKLIAACDVLPEWQGKVVSNGRLNLAKLFDQNGVFIIRGHIAVDNAVAKPIAGVSIYLNDNTKASAVTDANGDFKIGGLGQASYIVKPVLDGWDFAPLSRSVTLDDKTHNVNLTFKGTASASTYTISGRVTQTVDAAPVAGASIYLDDATEPVAATDSSGYYIIRHRTQGSYVVRAEKYGYNIISPKSGSQTITVTLPVTAQAPNATVNFKATVLDTRAPIVAVSRPLIRESIQQGVPLKIEGRATDETGIQEIRFFLTDGFGQFYDWRTGEFSFAAYNIYHVLPFKSAPKSVSFNFQALNLPVGFYGLYAEGVDTLGNATPFVEPTDFEVVSSEGAPVVWPTVAFTSPKGGSTIPAGPPVTVTGTYTADEPVEAIFLRILRYDEYGRVLGAYDWTQKKFVTDTTLFSTYKKLPQSFNSGNWQFTLPALKPGTYAVNAFGRSESGNEPPPGRSDDARVKFTYGGTTTSSTTSAATSVKNF